MSKAPDGKSVVAVEDRTDDGQRVTWTVEGGEKGALEGGPVSKVGIDGALWTAAGEYQLP